MWKGVVESDLAQPGTARLGKARQAMARPLPTSLVPLVQIRPRSPLLAGLPTLATSPQASLTSGVPRATHLYTNHRC